MATPISIGSPRVQAAWSTHTTKTFQSSPTNKDILLMSSLKSAFQASRSTPFLKISPASLPSFLTPVETPSTRLSQQSTEQRHHRPVQRLVHHRDHHQAVKPARL